MLIFCCSIILHSFSISFCLSVFLPVCLVFFSIYVCVLICQLPRSYSQPVLVHFVEDNPIIYFGAALHISKDNLFMHNMSPVTEYNFPWIWYISFLTSCGSILQHTRRSEVRIRSYPDISVRFRIRFFHKGLRTIRT